ncbi:PAS/PAC sensor signal transduction histidine kinase [Denitrovibrio acetiphilus DSM 12809]|uniref:histidine kinase n=1 Tax=Denitrovibrio acetiphilus (strain DSM 12809 / NBRC 114555 / N2460) TaxID=522772 RepID=D4H1L8_DENA2|nr:PAS domain-containing sensor histidine kinase [Denitrovibrio acetiphilus]ADD68778.1 PAS/PAC sensor signal transduction histidine kinase [Denitrovibrio acetiphilus DSM 12809]
MSNTIDSSKDKNQYRGDSASLAMKDMQKSRDKLQRTQLLAGIGAFEYLPEEKIIILSDEACAALGADPDGNILDINDFCKNIKQGQYNSFCNMLENFQTDELLGNIEFIYKGVDKQDRHVEVILEEPGHIIEGSVSGVFRNITRMRQAEIEKSVTAQAFETIFSNAKIAILVLNLKGYIIDYNNSALDLLGYTSEEMHKMHSAMLLHENDIMGAGRIFAKFINSAGKVNSLDYRIKISNGEIIDVLINFEMVIGAEGEKIYVFINDISNIRDMERKHIDQERMLIQQSKMATLGEMVALIAHQWQQPLNSIAMIVQMLDELIEVDEPNRKMLVKSVESVMAQVSFMTNTMGDFRNFLKPSDVRENFKIERVVQEVVRLYRPQLRHYDMNCEIYFSSENVKKAEVCGYENELKNVILNFLTNSRDAIENVKGVKGVVHIFVSEDEEKVHICIEDNGGGIPDHIMKRIFDPYVSSKGDKGTGLGLYMAKLIVKDRMNGDIHLENTDIGLRICISFKKC